MPKGKTTGTRSRLHPWFRANSLVGVTVAGYKLDKLLGTGGFGAVYLVASPYGESRAMKVLYPPHSLDRADLHVWDIRATRFLREAQTASRFNHPNIIKVFDTGQAHWHFEGRLKGKLGPMEQGGDYPLAFYVAEYIPDGLEQLLKGKQLLSPNEALETGMQICAALKVLHSAKPQVLHRDLNPGNIRIADGNRVVLADFGVARIEGTPGAYVTNEGPIINVLVGAPEQFVGEEGDVRTDVYQVGALLFLMLTGEPFREGREALLGRKKVSGSLATVIFKCLDPRRNNRYPNVENLEVALGSCSAARLHRAPSTEQERPAQLGDSKLRGSRGPVKLTLVWRYQLNSPFWMSSSTPVVESQDGCHIWDRHTIHTVRPDTGASIWIWQPPHGNRGRQEICPGERPVQVVGAQLYVRRGNSLFCLDTRDGSRHWQFEHWTDGPDDFLATKDVVVLASYDHGGKFMGPAALDAATGTLVWHLPDAEYHVDHMAVTDETLALVESVGISAYGGLRTRFVNLSDGNVLGIHQVVQSDGRGREKFGMSPESEAPIIVPQRPISLPDGSVLSWFGDLFRSDPYVIYFDPWLTVRWDRQVLIGDRRSELVGWGGTSLTRVGERVLVHRVSCDSAGGYETASLGNLDLSNGEVIREQRSRDNFIPGPMASAPDGTATFAIAFRKGKPKKMASRWILMALDPAGGDVLWKGPERETPGDSGPSSPVVTSSQVYLQLPLEPIINQGRDARLVGRGVIEAWHAGLASAES